MILYDSVHAPNPRRVRFFLAEKGVEVPVQPVDIGSAENRKPEFLEKNELGGLPVLELDDGSFIAESVAICRYFEETNPEPPLMGVDAADRARVEMWNRRMESEIFNIVTGAFRNTHDFFKGRITQVPAWGEQCKEWAPKKLEWLDGALADRPFVAGERFTIADITALCAIDFGRVIGLQVQAEQKNLTRWYEAVSSRPSSKA
ncbi:MAG: glutathione S-transferase family protein [Deltaproteobacteria bacterium]|nr:glutathione S-transferase family protein [Myxococcales bacterium]MCH8131718.1 glutathione S-transferase family protein [Myxococcales bacterium]TDJ12000.1 MAG: glutathione S-transferase family protein [Deltaproteobacteria bacterium]TDJ17927.1 MAG: glutathione S-transferase family protein [Deltaproteobacteria bacterium]